MLDGRSKESQLGDFKLGTPALVCRWRLAGRALPLESRHLRALGQRVIDDKPLDPPLIAWAKQHIEWTLAQGATEHPDGVLMLIVDHEGQAAMTVGPYEPLAERTVSALADRAYLSELEAEATGIAPEAIWVVREDQIICGAGQDDHLSGANSLMEDLAHTVGFPTARQSDLAASILAGTCSFDEAFLVSDEHGVVCARYATGPRSQRFSQGYERLLETRR